MTTAPQHPPTPPGIGHEHSDVSTRPLVIAGIGLAVGIVVAAALMLGLYDVFAAREARLSPPANPLAAAEGPRLPPQPRLQVQPIKDLRELREAEAANLDHYAWVDRNAGVVRIPIQRAIDLLAARSQQEAGKQMTPRPATPYSSPQRHSDTEASCMQEISVSLCLCGENRGWVGMLIALLFIMQAMMVRADTQPAIGQPATAQPEMLRGVGIDQRLDQQVPLDLVFRDETGADVTLGSLVRGKPVILSLVYYECPMLCTLVLNGMLSAMKALPFDAGREFDVITVSFNPADTAALAAQKKATYLGQYRRRGAERGWHFLTGDAASIERLADAVGFRYRYDPQRKEFAHAAGLTVLTPRGIVARYFFGVEFSPRDLKFGLMEAAENRIGSPIDQLLLLCYHYDPATGRYSTAVLTGLRVGAVLTVLALGGFMFWAIRRDRISAPPGGGGERPTRNAERRAAGEPSSGSGGERSTRNAERRAAGAPSPRG